MNNTPLNASESFCLHLWEKTRSKYDEIYLGTSSYKDLPGMPACENSADLTNYTWTNYTLAPSTTLE